MQPNRRVHNKEAKTVN